MRPIITGNIQINTRIFRKFYSSMALNLIFSYILKKSGTKWHKVVDYAICFPIFVF
jgi:hypothetical protein